MDFYKFLRGTHQFTHQSLSARLMRRLRVRIGAESRQSILYV
jgi:hypothetical protein